LVPILIVLVSAAGDAQQQPAVTFRTETNFVEVHAIVTDASGAFVRGLTGDDFEIYEDGRLQKPAAFALVDLPVERPRQTASGEDAADRRSGRRRARSCSATSGRTIWLPSSIRAVGRKRGRS
jgi:hypothetical protein